MIHRLPLVLLQLILILEQATCSKGTRKRRLHENTTNGGSTASKPLQIHEVWRARLAASKMEVAQALYQSLPGAAISPGQMVELMKDPLLPALLPNPFIPTQEPLEVIQFEGAESHIYWRPSAQRSNMRLLDIVSVRATFLPVICSHSQGHSRMDHFYDLAVVAQYMIPAWKEEIVLTEDLKYTFKLVSNPIFWKLSNYFNTLVAVMVYGDRAIGEKIRIFLIDNFGIDPLTGMSLFLPCGSLNPTFSRMISRIPIKNVYMVAAHWDVRMPELADHDFDFNAEVNCVTVLESMAHRKPKPIISYKLQMPIKATDDDKDDAGRLPPAHKKRRLKK